MNFQLIIICLSLIFDSNAIAYKTKTNLKDSYGHEKHELEKIGPLDEESNLALTIVTGSLVNTQRVADYYSSYGKNLTIYEQTKMHVKMNGKVSFLSELFNITFVEYKCSSGVAQINRQKCYASNSEASIPETLKSSIIGILGLEQILVMKPNTVTNKSDDGLNSASMPYMIIISYLVIFVVVGFGCMFCASMLIKRLFSNCSSLNQAHNKYSLATPI